MPKTFLRLITYCFCRRIKIELLKISLIDENYKEAKKIAGPGSRKGRTTLETYILKNYWEYLNGDKRLQQVVLRKIIPTIIVLTLIYIGGGFLRIQEGFIVTFTILYVLVILSSYDVANLFVRLSNIYFSFITLLPFTLADKPMTRRYQNTSRFMIALLFLSALWGLIKNLLIGNA